MRSAATIAVGVVLWATGCHHAPGPNVVATVNGKEIHRAELEKAYQDSLNQSSQQPTSDQAEIGRLQVLRGLIDNELLEERAPSVSNSEVEAKLADMKAPYTEEEWQRLLKEHNLTSETEKDNIRRQLAKDKLINKEISSKITITDAEIAAYYKAHKADFKQNDLTGAEPGIQDVLTNPRLQSVIRQQVDKDREQLLYAAYMETLRDQASVHNYLAEQIVKQANP